MFRKNNVIIFLFDLYCLIFILIYSSSTYAFEYHEPYSERVTLKLHLLDYNKILAIQDSKKNGLEIVYSPKNDILYINQIGYEYCINNLSLFFSTSMYNVGAFSFFKTRTFSLYYYFYKFAFDIYYCEYDLYDLYEIADDNYPERFNFYPEPELHSTHYGLNLYLALSDNFSYNAAFKQTERQSKSAGSIIMYISPYLSIYKSSEILIPDNQRMFYNEEAELKNFNIKSLLLSIGYCYNLTYDGFYIAPFGYIGKEYKSIQYNVAMGNQQKTQWENYYKWGAMIGYNESDSILVLEYFNDYKFINLKYSKIVLRDNSINLIIGYRI